MSNIVEILVKSKDQTKAGFASADKSTSSLGSKMGKLGKIGAAGFAVAGAAAVAWGVSSVKSLARIETINTQTAAAIKSTGGAAGVSGKHVEALAGKIESLTASEAEAVQEGANLLLTFTNIQNQAGKGNKIFDQATSVMNDMSVAMGTDMKSSAMLVGKALNDPIKGMGALSKAGVQFTDGQKETIKSLVEGGDTMKAQKIIIKELETQFGGSGEAFAKTASGKFALAQHKLGEIGETVFAKLLPPLADLAVLFTNKVIPAVSDMATSLGSKLGPTFEKYGAFLTSKFIPAVKNLAQDALEGLRGMFKNVGSSVEENRPFLEALGEAVKNVAKFILEKLYPALGWVFKTGLPALGKGIGIAITTLQKMSSGFLSLAIVGVKAFRHLLNAAFSTFGGILSAAEKGLGWIKGIGGKIRSAKEAFDNFKDKTVANLDKTAAALQRTQDKINGIKSPKPIKVTVMTGDALRAVSNLAFALRNIPNPKINLGGGNLYVPQKAHGGIGGGLAMVGERGRELVRLPQGSTTIPNGTTESMFAAAGRGQRVTLEFTGGQDEFSRVMVQMLRRYIRVSGGNVQTVIGS